jgi:hypothetical protein
MGGNLIIDGVSADRIPLDRIDQGFCSGILFCLRELNLAFKSHGRSLWEILDESLFSGSSRLLFDGSVKLPELASFKPTMGDIDVMFDHRISKELGDFLRASKGKTFGNFRLIGEGGNSLLQYNCIFEALWDYAPGLKFVQIDFEPVEFDDDGTPSEFARFAHSSNVEDIRAGIKGVFSKYLLRSLISNVEKLRNVAILTASRKVSKSKIYSVPFGMWKFSVDKGVRKAYQPVIGEDGLQTVVDGKLQYVALWPVDSDYITDLSTIFHMALRLGQDRHPLSFIEHRKMFSFCGMLRLMRTKMELSDCREVYLDFINLLWGTDAQVLYRDDPATDSHEKFLAAQEFLSVFPEFNSALSLNSLKSSFYFLA